MTEDDEAKYIRKISTMADVAADIVAKIINTQLALFMTELCIKKKSETLFGNIYISINGETCHIENPNKQLQRLRSTMGVSKKLINELPTDVKDVV